MKNKKNIAGKSAVPNTPAPEATEKKGNSLRVGTVIALLLIFVLLAAANLVMMIGQKRSDNDDAPRASAEAQTTHESEESGLTAQTDSEVTADDGTSPFTGTDEPLYTDENESTTASESKGTVTDVPETVVTAPPNSATRPPATVTTEPTVKPRETTPTPTVTTSTPETDAPKTTTPPPEKYVYPEYCAQVLECINAERKTAGLKPLALDETATKAAAIRATEITEVFSHIRPDGTSCFTVLDLFPKFFSWACAENIAAGLPSPKSVVECWMSSEGHRDNILTANYTHMGVAFTKTDSGYKYYWCLVLVQPEYGAL